MLAVVLFNVQQVESICFICMRSNWPRYRGAETTGPFYMCPRLCIYSRYCEI